MHQATSAQKPHKSLYKHVNTFSLYPPMVAGPGRDLVSSGVDSSNVTPNELPGKNKNNKMVQSCISPFRKELFANTTNKGSSIGHHLLNHHKKQPSDVQDMMYFSTPQV